MFEQRTTGSPGSRASDVKTGCHLPQNPIDGAPRTTSGGPGRRPPIPRERAARRPPRTDERACCPPQDHDAPPRRHGRGRDGPALQPDARRPRAQPRAHGAAYHVIRQRVNQIVAARLESWPPRHRRGAGSTHRLARAQVLRRPPRGRVVRARVEGRSAVLRLGPRAAATGVEITPSRSTRRNFDATQARAARRARGLPNLVTVCVEINQCVVCTR